MAIEVKNISKTYGTQKALDNISFTIEKGEIVGFLGPNGAGKSTLMKILTTYLKPTEGTAFVNHFDVQLEQKAVQQSVGYLPEHNPLYLDLYVREYLEFNANIYKISQNRINEVIELTGLSVESHKKIGQLSKGFRQRVGLANALLHNPEVLILDEPTTGLDPNQLVEIRNLIQNVGQNKTVFLSTHIMQEVEAICDRVIIINHGKIVTDKKLTKLISEDNEQILEVEFDFMVEKQLLATLPNLKSLKNIHDMTWELTFVADQDMRASIFDFAQKNGLKTLQLLQKNKNLESIFREITNTK
ncbi:gliding motility-associated ABC transporter ATP-binding subunit GldA [Flavobacterium branchiophilum NBRC 15030 = ATCC 35035]|uniref:Protein involved in gliding motility GldA n=1 Tax=Flavobacterium branchiophilum TaxID=55197 RepID=A0A543G6B5_9FLAO|nr:gliding motility-associated ABC transporter ATP-binding subunit GldA [Flavobacterium branchiophilum]OXA77140.1 gliding motility-associated ABC transporter ATP-binding subunit GldA [Flavobacterium branchiophilum NBRC 15030 = ATCC 35035]TQM41629.1 protein involved in gliding motility GldA [Flavobacterium branchiophilum]GEM55306.1 gliding motility-associated ABC transporter ATP-binding subunit GldA [Flavobacterium branchiophilum NBRC 15030 = ATCC 35035]